jgi:hypothetical protein
VVIVFIAEKLVIPIIFSLLRPIAAHISLILFGYWASERAWEILWI